LALDEPNENVKVHNINEIEVIIDDNILPYTENNQIDYIENSYGEGFSIGPIGGSTGCC
jgi:Fe-S cluster assembly iron-binding protein IscA